MSSYVCRLIRDRRNDDVDRGWEITEDLFNIEWRRKVEKTFSSIMSEFMKGISEDDKKKMMACGEKMASMCPQPEDGEKAKKA